MTFFLILAGAMVCALICGVIFDGHSGGAGFLFGAISGFLFARLQSLRDQVSSMQREIAHLKGVFVSRKSIEQKISAAATKSDTESPATTVIASPQVPEIRNAVLQKTPTVSTPLVSSAETISQPHVSSPAESKIQKSTTSSVEAENSKTHTPPPLPPQPAASKLDSTWTLPIREPSEPDMPNKVLDYLKRWFTEGNVPVKVGVLVLFGGVGALLKYAIDQEWISFPIELRLAGIAAAALVGLVFAWRKRDSHRAFALSLQGGAIGVLMMTVFAAFRLYSLLNMPITFGLLVILVVGIGVLAVLQNSLALAFLGIVGGFLTPILVSTGSGNHVALFSYYGLLNAAILGIAWVKPWRVLNLAGFAFTFGIGTAWGVLKYQPEFFSSTEPFLILFFLFYLAIPVLYALRQPSERRGLVDGTLVFGTPLLAFPLQVGLLQGDKMQLAYSALIAALIYAVLAWLLLKKWALKLLGESHAILALGFATLAVPLAFSARSTACAWALEGVALVWLGLRQQRRIQHWIGYLLQLLAGGAYLWSAMWYSYNPNDLAILNGDFLSTLLISLAGFSTFRLLTRDSSTRLFPNIWFAWGLAWWIFMGCHEIDRFAPSQLESTWLFGFVTSTFWLAAELFRRWDWRECLWLTSALYPFSLLFIPLTNMDNHGPLEGYGALVWGMWLLATLRILVCLHVAGERWIAVLHFIFLWTMGLVLSTEFVHLAQIHYNLVNTWVVLGGFAPLAFLFWSTLQRLPLVRFPVKDAAEKHRGFLLATLTILLGVGAFLGLFAEGKAYPLPYIPLLNPLELAQVFLLLLLLRWYRHAFIEGKTQLPPQQIGGIFATLSFALLTSITLRSVHFFGAIPWSDELFASSLGQASLSVVWSVTGIVAMLIGAKRGSRSIWIVGALLMGVVIGKLILVDRHHLRDLSAILSVLTVGLLLLAVGYFAPAPPRRGEETGAN